jgi:glycosyltransferase involved in cell wall biosynthesis
MSAALFFDPVCVSPYSAHTLEEAALGGTEATVVRIAEALDARVVQHNRTLAEGRYLPPVPLSDVEHLIVLRDPRALPALCKRYPGARPYVWMHDLARPGSTRGRRLASVAGLLTELAATIVCVSDFQRRQIEAVLARLSLASPIRVLTIYNPIDDGLAPETTPIDPAKLVFFSSPNKGLAYTLDAFQVLRRALPDLHLAVGSPGYKTPRRAGIRPVERIAGVEWLGPLPHARILEEVRTALCVFYPNFVLPETFGLVLAEARAVGTPVLTHDCGAAAEVLRDERQVLPVSRGQRLYERLARLSPSSTRALLAAAAGELGVFRPYLQRLREWREGARPSPRPDERFRLSTVAARWRALLAGELSQA